MQKNLSALGIIIAWYKQISDSQWSTFTLSELLLLRGARNTPIGPRRIGSDLLAAFWIDPLRRQEGRWLKTQALLNSILVSTFSCVEESSYCLFGFSLEFFIVRKVSPLNMWCLCIYTTPWVLECCWHCSLFWLWSESITAESVDSELARLLSYCVRLSLQAAEWDEPTDLFCQWQRQRQGQRCRGQ